MQDYAKRTTAVPENKSSVLYLTARSRLNDSHHNVMYGTKEII